MRKIRHDSSMDNESIRYCFSMLLISLYQANEHKEKWLISYFKQKLIGAAALNLGQSAARLDCFSLLLDRRLFISPADFQFLE
jgi:hypothetical protein